QYIYVVLRREQIAAGTKAGIDFIHGKYDAKQKKHLREPLRSFRVEALPASGRWTLRWHYGLLQVEQAGVPVAYAYLEGGARSGWGAVAIGQRSGRVRCRRLELAARVPEAELTLDDKLELMSCLQSGHDGNLTLHLSAA